MEYSPAQSSQSIFGLCFLAIFRTTPLLSFCTLSSDLFIHGGKCSVVQIWKSASLDFFLNSPAVCSISLPVTISFGTPSRVNRVYRLWWDPTWISLNVSMYTSNYYNRSGHRCSLIWILRYTMIYQWTYYYSIANIWFSFHSYKISGTRLD